MAEESPCNERIVNWLKFIDDAKRKYVDYPRVLDMLINVKDESVMYIIMLNEDKLSAYVKIFNDKSEMDNKTKILRCFILDTRELIDNYRLKVKDNEDSESKIYKIYMHCSCVYHFYLVNLIGALYYEYAVLNMLVEKTEGYKVIIESDFLRVCKIIKSSKSCINPQMLKKVHQDLIHAYPGILGNQEVIKTVKVVTKKTTRISVITNNRSFKIGKDGDEFEYTKVSDYALAYSSNLTMIYMFHNDASTSHDHVCKQCGFRTFPKTESDNIHCSSCIELIQTIM